MTYNGTATVGTTNCGFKAVVPENATTKPKITAMVLSPSGSLSSTFNGLFIQRKTSVVADFTSSSEYSTIASHKMTVEGKSYSGDPATSDILSKTGNVVISGVATDARGFPSVASEQTINSVMR